MEWDMDHTERERKEVNIWKQLKPVQWNEWARERMEGNVVSAE